ncbi:ABC transporter permease [Micromonospora sp. CP22]|uniref:ABC transporter permease n=1 Tax=Micromonospora sp. CP22 TaxID=2580517 RepID=UPI0028164C34|nr:ABC transporter permease [Micromonospora sp. CP22]
MSGSPRLLSRARLAEAIGSWRAALRIARREARRARGRTALVLAMIILPVLALSFVSVSVEMSRLTPSEELDRRLGSADAELRVVSRSSIQQSADGTAWISPGDEDKIPAAVTGEYVAALLPEGSHVLPVRRWVPFSAWQGDRIRDDIDATVIDLTDPLGRDLARIHRGRAPAAADEIAVNLAARRSLGVDLGDRVVAGDSPRSWTVVGVAELPERLSPMVILHPAGAPTPNGSDEVFLADLPGPVTDDVYQRLNQHGIVVTARMPAPPPGAPLDQYDPMVGGTSLENVSTGVLVGGLGLLEVVLLVGPAFAVGVRRRRRELALVAVAGGDAAHLRRVVLADGVVLGGAGAVIGIALGVAAACAGRPLVEQFIFHERLGGYRVWPPGLIAIALVALLAGVLAALAPAWTAARQDVVAGLAGRRTPPTHRRRWLTIGIALAAGGTVVAAIGAVVTSQSVILAGLVLGELGLVFATPTLVGLLARLGRFLPLVPRIAVRDASRNRASAAPAISAVMAAVAGSVALGLFLASDEVRTEQRNRAFLPEHTVLVTYSGEIASDNAREQISGLARELLGTDTIAPLVSAGCAPDFDSCMITATMPPERLCPWRPYQPLSEGDQQRARADPRCQYRDDTLDGPYLRVAVDDGTALGLLTGVAPDDVAAGTATLRSGGAVITDDRFLRDGRLDLRVEHGDETRSTDTATVPGHALHTGLGEQWLVLSPAAADRLGLVARQIGWALNAEKPPGQRQHDDLAAALRPLAPAGVSVEWNRSHNNTRPLLLLLAGVAAVVTIGAAAIATGLAAAEARTDLSTLGAVGASPRVRRLLSLCQAGLITVLGSALGIVAGLASALVVMAFTNQRYADQWPIEPPYPLVMPWPTLGVLAAVPLVAMLGAALFTRSRLPVERRLD